MKCNFPESIGAGLTFNFMLTLTAYPADQWSVTVHLRGPMAINLNAEADGNQHRFSASATETAGWKPGQYWYTMRASDGENVVEVEAGQVQINADITTEDGSFDGRSPAQIALDAIDAVLASRATIDQERYRINNRELHRTPIADLIKLRTFYSAQVQREKAKACGKNLFNNVLRVRLK